MKSQINVSGVLSRHNLVTLKIGGGAWSNYIHSEMMQMLLTMSHRIPTTYKGAVRGSWDSAEFEAALLTHYTALLEQRCDCGCALVYYWALSRGRARMLSVQTQWLKSYWTHMISILNGSIRDHPFQMSANLQKGIPIRKWRARFLRGFTRFLIFFLWSHYEIKKIEVV